MSKTPIEVFKPQSDPLQRRLATIVAIDVAGYSLRVERDEVATLHQTIELKQLVLASADAHAGRIFHTAGDGFMLEFATISGALLAADRIRTGSPLPVRIGAHVGEVSVTDSADLLGHGVNVAARLQAKAPVNGILVSADIVRAERGQLARHFSAKGRIKLNKMKETLSVFLFEPNGPTHRALPQWANGRTVLSIVAAAALLIALPLAWIAIQNLTVQRERLTQQSGHGPKISIMPFSILGDADSPLSKFRDELQARMVDQFSKDAMNVAPPGQLVGVSYAFEGAVEREGGELVVHLRLDDVAQHATVWSEEVRRPRSNALALQNEIAVLAAQVAQAAKSSVQDAKGDDTTLGLLIKSELYPLRNRQEDREAEWRNNNDLLARLPNNQDILSKGAIISAFLAATSNPQRAAEMKALALKQANAALKINARTENAYLAKALVYPLIGHWSEREAALLAGLKILPQSPVLTNHQSNLLREVGRLRDAVIWARQAEATKPPSANREATLVFALAGTGANAEASSVSDELARAWPNHAAAWNGRLHSSIYRSRWSEALALFEPVTVRVAALDEPERSAWVMALNAMRFGDAAAKRSAARAFAALPAPNLIVVQPPHEIYSPADRIGMLAVLGANDEAFAEADTYLQRNAYADSSFLFWPNIEAFRQDPRFLHLVTKAGLLDYWKSSGNWPDFCSDPKLPYSCGSK